MAEKESDDANAGVPLWVNIVVPITMFSLFILVQVWLFFTDKEFSVETIERWERRIPFLKQKENKDEIDGRSRHENQSDSTRRSHGSQTGSMTTRQNLSGSRAHSYGSMISGISASIYSHGGGYLNPKYSYESNV